MLSGPLTALSDSQAMLPDYCRHRRTALGLFRGRETGDFPMMKRALTAATLSLLASTPAWAATPGWSVSERSGTVTILRGGISRIALLDGAVASNDVIATGPNGRAVLVRGEEFLVVAPNSRLRVADPAQTSGFVQIIEEAGNVIYRIKRMTMQHFAVQTPYLAAVVKGTTFSVSVGPEGATVQVIEGAVEVATSDGGARELIKPGMVASVGARDLGRLKIDGDRPREIVSPKPPAAPLAESDAQATPAVVEIIEAPVSEPVQSVAALTGGLIEGNTGLQLAVATVAVSRETRASVVSGVAFDSSPENSALIGTEDSVETTVKTPPTPAPLGDALVTVNPDPINATAAAKAPVQNPIAVATDGKLVPPLPKVDVALEESPTVVAIVAPPATVPTVTVAADPAAAPSVAPPAVAATATAAPTIVAEVSTPVAPLATPVDIGNGQFGGNNNGGSRQSGQGDRSGR